ncbi:hypothetical protein PG987_013440 [Apiospora arundinis]
MLPRSLFRAAALQGRQQQLLSPSRVRAALFAAAKTQVVAYSSSSQRGDADGQDGGASGPRSYKAFRRIWTPARWSAPTAAGGRLIKILHDLVECPGFATASVESPMDLKVSGGVHLLDRLDGLRPPEGAKANKSGSQPQPRPVADVTGHPVYRWVTHPYISKLIEENMSEIGGFANGTA